VVRPDQLSIVLSDGWNSISDTIILSSNAGEGKGLWNICVAMEYMCSCGVYV
jgi:hypothetical protein